MWNDGRTDAGVTGVLLAHPLAFGSCELNTQESEVNLKNKMNINSIKTQELEVQSYIPSITSKPKAPNGITTT